MTEACPEDFVRFANMLADASGAVIRPHFRTGVAVEDKADASPVTVADRTAESAIRERIEHRYPEHGIYGEEHGVVRSDARYVWVLDPIDGTKSFIAGAPVFGTLIALLDDGIPILGVIDQPVSQERWVGANGQGTQLNGQAAHVRSDVSLAKALLYSTTPDMFVDEDAPRYEALRSAVGQARFGLDCYAAGLLASGHIDLHVEGKMQPYDYLALVPVIENAGGVITDWQGQPLRLDSGGFTLAAATEELHQAARALLDG
jgi:inositol-phosphate phosphatase/L-galactose 1-phosphate phosphatase/histidinol-phosphatase